MLQSQPVSPPVVKVESDWESTYSPNSDVDDPDSVDDSVACESCFGCRAIILNQPVLESFWNPVQLAELTKMDPELSEVLPFLEQPPEGDKLPNPMLTYSRATRNYWAQRQSLKLHSGIIY